MIQDKFGFMWIGCDAGLFRYDGTRFKQFNYTKENGRSISELKFDSHGNLWCQNFTGQVFKVGKDSLMLFKDFSNEFRSFPHFSIDKDDNVWITGEKCIQKLDPTGKLIKEITLANNTQDTISWFDIETGFNNEVFVTSQKKGLAYISLSDNTYHINWINAPEIRGRCFIEKINGELFILSENEQGKKYVISQVRNDKSIESYLPIEMGIFVYKLQKDKKGKLWVTTSNGVYEINPVTKSVDTSNYLLRGDKISCFVIDKEDNMWFSSLQNGIHVLPSKELVIYNKQNSFLKDTYVSALFVNSKGQLLIGTYSGYLHLIDPKQKKEVEFFPLPNESRAVKKMLEYNNGYLVSQGIFNYLHAGNGKKTVLKNARDFCILNDTLYFASSHNFGFLPNLKRTVELNESYKPLVTIIDKAGRSIAADSKTRKVFLASIDGLFVYHNANLQPILFNNIRINASKIVWHNDRLWIGTLSNGFLSYHEKTITIETRINKLLKGGGIKTFKIHGDLLWVATEKCLNKVNLQNNSADYYELSDGLISKEINDIEFVDSLVYLATNKGLMEFPQNLGSMNSTIPPIKITDVELNGRSVEPGNNFVLDYSANRIKINFISVGFRSRGKLGYKYRLLGSDTTWTYLGNSSNEVIYSLLPPGSFTFEVKALNEDKVESKEAATISVFINKPFWQTWWFYLFIGLSGALIVLFIALAAIRDIRKKALLNNELITSQLTAIRAQMNPHFMYNTLNSIQELILSSDIKSTNYYLSKFSSLMRKILEFSEKEKVLLAEEIEMLQNYLELEKLRFGNEFFYSITVSPNINLNTTFLPSLIVQPFIENAIKHGLLHKKGQKNLSLALDLVNDLLLIVIEDNGVGRKRSEEIKQRSDLYHKSFATSAVQKRLELLNSNKAFKISYKIIDLITPNEALGTRVEITIQQ